MFGRDAAISNQQRGSDVKFEVNQLLKLLDGQSNAA